MRTKVEGEKEEAGKVERWKGGKEERRKGGRRETINARLITRPVIRNP